MDAKTYARLRAIAEELMSRHDMWAVEVDEAGITMMMPPVNRHELITKRLRRQLEAQIARVTPTPSGTGCPSGHGRSRHGSSGPTPVDAGRVREPTAEGRTSKGPPLLRTRG